MSTRTITVDRPSPRLTLAPRHARRTPRDNLEPAMLAMLAFIVAFALIVIWPLLPAVEYLRTGFAAACVAGGLVAVYVAATYGARR